MSNPSGSRSHARRLALIALLCAHVGTAHADTRSLDEAKRLKNLGAEALAAGNHALAIDSFRRALQLFPSANLRYDLAVALEGAGKYPEALDEYEGFLVAAPTAPDFARAHAFARVAELSHRVGTIELEVSPEDATVTVDGQHLPPHATRLRVLPGTVEIVAQRVGYATATQQLLMLGGEQRHIRLSLTPLPHDTVAVTPPILATPPKPATPPRTPLVRRWWLWTAVAVAAAGIAVGVGVGVGVAAGQPTTPATFHPNAGPLGPAAAALAPF